MHTRRMTISFLVILVLGLAPLGFGQLLSPQRAHHGTLGYYDPATGLFEALRPAMDGDEVPATAATTGTLTFSFTITVKSTVPKNAVITCQATAIASDPAGGFTEEGGAVATGSGATRTCTVVIPYSWNLTTPTKDSISLATSASMEYGYEVTATNGTATLVVPAVLRTSGQPLGVIAVPANGASTTKTVAVTL